jgi:hypothetical protein
VSGEGEKVLQGFNRYDLVNVEAKDMAGISRIMGNIHEIFN